MQRNVQCQYLIAFLNYENQKSCQELDTSNDRQGSTGYQTFLYQVRTLPNS